MKPPSAGAAASLALAALAALAALPTTASAVRGRNNASAVASPPVENPEVPPALANNFPQLPAVSAMMGAASETLKSVNSQASVLEARVAQAQLEDEAKLARQKAVFEQKLKVQEAKNQLEVQANAEITREIAALKANNTALKKRAQDLQDGNHLMRTELRALQTRFGMAQDFVAAALKDSVDTEAPELAVLRPPAAAVVHTAHRRREKTGQSREEQGEVESTAAKRDEEQDEKEDSEDRESEEEDDDGDGNAASLLSLAARVRRAEASRTAVAASATAGMDVELQGPDSEASSPGDLLAVLSKGVADLQKEEKESEAKLKAMFLSSFRAGTRRHATLLGQQRSLNSTRSTLQTLRAKLEAADERLEKTRSGLERKLRGVGLFAQRLAHLALAPAAEVQRLMQALPQEVIVAPAAGQVAAGVVA